MPAITVTTSPNLSPDKKEIYSRFINYEPDKRKQLRAIMDYRDWIYILVKVKLGDEDTTSYITNLEIYNKFERFPFQTPASILSGVPGLAGDPSDMSIDDDGNIYIASSGQITRYKQLYDYALITRTTGTMKTNITLREKYDGLRV